MSPALPNIRSLSCLGCLLAGLVLASAASAQWTTESYPLKAGYNAIWLSIDTSDRSIDDLLAGNSSVTEVWQWNVNASSTHFTASPVAPDQADAQWKVWKRGLPAETTLGLLTGNAAYLIRVADGASSFSLSLKGKPVAPRYDWKSTGVNFVGFPTASSTPPSFTDFLKNSKVLKQAPPVFFYDGGALSVNPNPVTNRDGTSVNRGRAYWVQVTDYTDFYGPLKVSALNGNGVEFGAKLNSSTIRVKNVIDPSKNEMITATFSLVGSESAPAGGAAATGVSLRVRGVLDANLQFTYTSLPTTITLAPGEEVDLVLDANRALMSTTGQSYESILRITDSLGHTRIDLPASAIGSSKSGVWVGGAVIDAVDRVEVLKGPEIDAPLNTPDGTGAETTSSVVRTVTSNGGQTTDQIVFDAAFDADDRVYLPSASLSAGNVVVTGPTGSPTFALTTDYTLGASSRGTVTSGGSGYSEIPSVAISGGGGTGAAAYATLSAAVSRIQIVDGGAGYTSAPTVAIVGDGEGATAVAIIADGIVTDVSITNGGSLYSVPPLVTISGGGATTQAVATTTLSGSVGSITITDGGSGYTGVPQVVFSSSDGVGSGASATVRIVNEVVTGVDVVEKVPAGDIGSSARFSVSIVKDALVGTPDSVTSSTVTSTSKLVTLNGKSHLETKRVSTGEAAAAPSQFPIRLILHSTVSGAAPTLLQQVYLGESEEGAYASAEEAILIAALDKAGSPVENRLARVSSASFPRAESWTGTGTFGSTVTFSVVLGHDAPSNPFVHTYHPDHDNWDARYENKLAAGEESYEVTRTITLTFSATPPPGISDLTWGVTTLGGTYTEVISGLRSQEIGISGAFVLQLVSDVPALTTETL